MAYRYSFKAGERMACAVGVSLPISKKQSVEICDFVRGRSVEESKRLLSEVGQLKRAVPFRRFNMNVGHKPGMAAGRFPSRAAAHIMALIESAESNAQAKGLNAGSLVIRHISAQKAPDAWHYGRLRRRKMRRAHVEVVVEESKDKGGVKK